MAGIYIHIPFCRQFCHYCDFYSSRSLKHKKKLLEALLREMELQRGFMPEAVVSTIYIGGGTPTVYAPSELQRLIDRVRELWDVNPDAEITAEANPDDLSPDYFSALSHTDVNRLSIGVQSFIDRDLRLMNRRHTAASAIDAVHKAQKAGFENLSIDLMYGIPGMSGDEWQANIERAVALDVPHISAYHLSIERGTRFGSLSQRGKLVPVDDDESERQYLVLHRALAEAGYNHYEISNFARPGFAARHNSAYWSGRNYLGVGPSAHSYNGHERRWSVKSVAKYLSGIESGTIYESETLSRADQYNEYVMTSLRCAKGIDTSELSGLFGMCGLLRFEKSAYPYIKAGTLIRDGDRVRIPPESFLVSDRLISALFC